MWNVGSGGEMNSDSFTRIELSDDDAIRAILDIVLELYSHHKALLKQSSPEIIQRFDIEGNEEINEIKKRIKDENQDKINSVISLMVEILAIIKTDVRWRLESIAIKTGHELKDLYKDYFDAVDSTRYDIYAEIINRNQI
jgi:hypothetical protein